MQLCPFQAADTLLAVAAGSQVSQYQLSPKPGTIAELSVYQIKGAKCKDVFRVLHLRLGASLGRSAGSTRGRHEPRDQRVCGIAAAICGQVQLRTADLLYSAQPTTGWPTAFPA